MDAAECLKTECGDGEHPSNTTGCYLKEEKYKRVHIYRNWYPGCKAIENDFTDKKFYVLEHHGTWHYGSEAVVRCMPGYMLPLNLTGDVSVTFF